VIIFASDESTNAAQTAPSGKANLHFGAVASTTTEEAVNISAEDSGHEHETYDASETVVLIKENTYDSTDQSDDDEAEATLSSFNSDGFTVDWTTMDTSAQATIFPYLALGSPNGTDVKLETFDVVSDEKGRSFYWRTGFESGSLGFNIYDQHQGRQRLLTPQLIAGSALLVGVGQPLTSGRSYHWQAGPDLASTQYWLEEISVDGKKTMYGPFTARRGTPPGGVAAISSPLLSDLGRLDLLGSGTAGAEGLNARDEVGPGPVGARQPDDLAALPGIKLLVRRDGFFRVSADQLIAAGLDPTVDPRRLRLFAGGYEVRLRVTGEDDGRLDPGDAVEFYGVGNDTVFTDARVYWLAATGGHGARLTAELAPPQRSLRVSSFPYTVEDKPRSIYFAALLNGDDNNFFGPVVAGTALDRHVAVHHLARGAGEPARLRVRLQGASESTHRVTVKINGQALGEVPFEGRARQEGLFDVPLDGLADGDNVITLSSGAVEDVVLLDSVRLTYPHGLVADEDAQRVTLPPRRGIKLAGFSSERIRAFDVTHPDAAVELPLTSSWDGQAASATVSPLRNGGTVLFVGEKRVGGEVPLVKNDPSHLRQAQAGADLLMITHASLAPALEPLRKLREQQGLQVQVIDVQDIYDEFNNGEKSPYAIREFLQSAGRTFERRPRFVLLFGDASFDSRDYLGLGDHDLVPTRLVDTWPLETASDDWFGDFDGQGLSTLAVGRIPARTLEVARTIVDKLVHHDAVSLGSPGRALLIGDQNTAGDDFEAMARQAALALPGNMPVSLRLRGQPLDPSDPLSLIEAINRGPSLIEYFGHGSVDLWNGVLSAGAAAGLTNRDRLSLVVSMTCLNGFFQDARMTTMAEALLGAPNGGAYAVWASSGYTRSKDQQRMAEAFVRAVLQDGLTLGEAAGRAKAGVSDEDVRRTWILFGDPSHAAGATMKLQSQPDSQAMGCQFSPRATSPLGALFLAAIALLVRRRRR
jgi:MYXO-CTERM domain-containing protein